MRNYYGNDWQGGWHRHPDDDFEIASVPAAGSRYADNEYLVVRGLDGNVYQKTWYKDDRGWGPWESLGAP